MIDFNSQYNKYRDIFEKYLNEQAEKLEGHKTLIEAMKYSLLAGGKRVRPVLMLASTEMFGGEIEKVLPFAFSLECIHTYSLIHDDLPAMDDDDLRRGMPTNHVRFGQDFAILAGDALLNLAFEHTLSNISSVKEIKALSYMAECSGYCGMVGGQAFDIRPLLGCGEKQLLVTELKKTSKLICASLVIPAILFDGNVEIMEKFGELLGVIYQYVDDILDVTSDALTLGKSVNKDAEQEKISAVRVFGLEKAKQEVEKLRVSSEELIQKINNSEFLKTFLNNSVVRVK